MTLDDAIRRERHAMRQSFGERSAEHRQLAEWLRELRDVKAENEKLRELVRDMRACRDHECGSCQHGDFMDCRALLDARLRELGIEVDNG